MAGTRFPRDRSGPARAAWIAAVFAAVAVSVSAAPPLRDAPVIWYEADREAIEVPDERDPNLTWDMIETSVVRPLGRLTSPSRILRRAGTILGGDPVRPAANVNALDEVPNGSWFTNRIGLYPVTPGEAARGPCTTDGPSREGKWTVIRAKTEGVTPGFSVRDARGDVYVIKFDPPGFLGMTTAAGIISNRIFHGAGYFVPEDGAVIFDRQILVVGDHVSFRDDGGIEREMTEEDVDRILERVERLPDGSFLAVWSKYLSGKPVGPFDYRGRRKDDRNDRVPHHHRRELRGLRVFAAWLNHFDTKQENTLDMYVGEPGAGHVRHHLIDFASTVGAGGRGPRPIHGYEYGADVGATALRLGTLGLHEDSWRLLERPDGLDEIGYFESYLFDPDRFKPLTPNTAFANLTDRDGYWAAKIVSAFTDDHLAAIVEEAHFRNPDAAGYMVRVLAERRDKIARTWFDRVPPLDFFTPKGDVLLFRDLGEERGVYEAGSGRYRARVAPVDENRRAPGESEWIETAGTRVKLGRDPYRTILAEADPGEYPFCRVDLSLSRGGGWSDPVRVYVARGSGRVVAVER